MSIELEMDYGNTVLIPPGEYDAIYISHEVVDCITYGFKVKIAFRIVSPGKYCDTLLDAWYPVKNGNTKRVGGKIGLTGNQKLANEFFNLFELKTRPDRLSLIKLKGYVIRVAVGTVTTNGKKELRAEPLQYSVVKSMLRLVSYHGDDVDELALETSTNLGCSAFT
jgi:hypothetical protein